MLDQESERRAINNEAKKCVNFAVMLHTENFYYFCKQQKKVQKKEKRNKFPWENAQTYTMNAELAVGVLLKLFFFLRSKII